MTLLAAIVLALLGLLGTGWVVWLRREHERDADAAAAAITTMTAEVAALRGAVNSLRLQVVALRARVDATHAELTEFVHGPPSLRSPIIPRGGHHGPS